MAAVKPARIGARRELWLRTVDRLTTELRRPPCVDEVSRVVGISRSTGQWHTNHAARAGQVLLGSRNATSPRALRLTPATRIELGLPLVVYLAWPLPPEPVEVMPAEAWGAGCSAAEDIATDLGLCVVSPFLVCASIGASGSMSYAARVSCTTDAVIIWRDALLMGRADVDAAWRAGLPVSVVSGDLPSAAADLWIPPRLVPPFRAS